MRQEADMILEECSQHCGHSAEKRKVALRQPGETEEQYLQRMNWASHGLEMFVFIS